MKIYLVVTKLARLLPSAARCSAYVSYVAQWLKVVKQCLMGAWIFKYLSMLFHFEGKCISDPDKCPDGITMMFWAKIEKMNVFPNPSVPKFIFSSGGSDHNSRGFSFFHQNGMYVLEVANSMKKWRKSILHTKIPYNSWFSFAFTWDKGGFLLLHNTT